MEKNYAFKIVAAAEDFAAIMFAQELSRQLADELEPEFELSSDAWNFEELDNLQLGREAARKAANANMIIIAASGAAEPPAHVKRWIESWLPRKRKGMTALVALLDDDDETPSESSPLCAYLRRIADKWGVDYFSNTADGWQQYLESTTEAPHRQQETPQPYMSEALSA